MDESAFTDICREAIIRNGLKASFHLIDQTGYPGELFFLEPRWRDTGARCLSYHFAVRWLTAVESYYGPMGGDGMRELVEMLMQAVPFTIQKRRQFNNRTNNLYWTGIPLADELYEAYATIRRADCSFLSADSEAMARFIKYAAVLPYPGQSSLVYYRDILLFLLCQRLNGRLNLADILGIADESREAIGRIDEKLFRDQQYVCYFSMQILAYLRVLARRRLLPKPSGKVYYSVLRESLKEITGMEFYLFV